MNFIVITGPTYDGAEKKIKSLSKIPAGVELRLDLFNIIDLEKIRDLIKLCHSQDKKVILTLRSTRSGGNYKGSFEVLEEEIKSLSNLKPDYVDVEWILSDQLFDSLKDVKVIASHHDFDKTPLDLEKLITRMKEKTAYAYKVCTTATDVSDSFRMIKFIHKQAKSGVKIIGLCMGSEGKITRVDGPKVGNYLNYKIIHTQDKVAPGLDFS